MLHFPFEEGEIAIVKRLAVNERIRAKEVLVIGETGNQLGILPLQQALEIAREHSLDLVEVAATSVPPVCRLLDYGKYKYQQAKKEREGKKSQKGVLLREVRLRPGINGHDLDLKIRLIKRLLSEGSKVKVRMRFRGREIAHPERGKEILRQILIQLKEEALAGQPQMEERNLSLTLSPLKQYKRDEKNP